MSEQRTIERYWQLAESLPTITDLEDLLKDMFNENNYLLKSNIVESAQIAGRISARIIALKNKDKTNLLLKNTDVEVGWIRTEPYTDKEQYKKLEQSFILSIDNVDLVVEELYQALSRQVCKLRNGVIVVDLRESVLVPDKFSYTPDINLGALIITDGQISGLRDYIRHALMIELNKSIPYTEDNTTFLINSINMYYYYEPQGAKSKNSNNCLFHALKIYDENDISAIREWWKEPSGPIPLNKAEEIVTYLKLTKQIPITCNISTDKRHASYNDIILEHDHYSPITHGWKDIKIPSIEKFPYILTHYDIETYRKPHKTNSHEFVFSVGGLSIVDSNSNILIDFACVVSPIDILNMSVNKAIQQGVKHVYLNAYNGRAFDHYLMLESCIDLIDVKKYLNKKNQILRVDFVYENITFIMWDINKIIDGTLDNNLRVLVGMEKIVFDRYSEIDKWHNMSEELQISLINYLKRDVEGLRELYIVLNNNFKNLGFSDIVRYISASQMSFNNYLLTSYDPYNAPIMVPPVRVDRAFKSSCYGGRSHPVRQEFSSSFPEDLIVARDIVSLYPSALCEEYPIGVPKLWCYKDKEVIKKIESGEYMAICFVSFDALNCNLLEPILPKRMSSSGHLQWDFVHGEGWYTSVSINIARSFGYRFIMQNGYYWEKKTALFKEYIEKLFSIRQRYGKKHPLNITTKLLLNGFYGKLIQKAVTTKVKICKNADETYREIHKAIVKRATIKRYTIGNKTFLELNYPQRNEHITKPSHYGAFCLDYSKKIVLKYMLEYDALKEQNKLFYYINTDCIFIHSSQIPNKHNSEMLGGMKDEYSAGIIKGIFISPKIYYLLLSDGTEVMHMKGIDVRQSAISLWHYTELLAGRDVEVKVPFQICKNMFPMLRADNTHVKALTLYYHENVVKIISPKTWDCRTLHEGYYVPSKSRQL